jgi:hypothetical protein
MKVYGRFGTNLSTPVGNGWSFLENHYYIMGKEKCTTSYMSIME